MALAFLVALRRMPRGRVTEPVLDVGFEPARPGLAGEPAAGEAAIT